MNRHWTTATLFASFVIVSAGVGADDEKTGSFPRDKAGRLIENLLRPTGMSSVQGNAGQRVLATPAAIEQPNLPLVAFQGDSPKAKPELGGKVLPRPLSEDLPFIKQKIDPARPRGVKLPPGYLFRLQSVDVNQPAPLPALGKLLPDRAPLTDPTLEASVAIALQKAIPERLTPAPFVRMSLPDPFEHSQTVRLRTPPPEDSKPSSTQPRAPKK